MPAQQIKVLQETDQEMWKTTLSYFTTTNINHHQTCSIRIISLLLLDLVVCLLQVVWWRNSAEGEVWDQHCPDWRLQYSALQ